MSFTTVCKKLNDLDDVIRQNIGEKYAVLAKRYVDTLDTRSLIALRRVETYAAKCNVTNREYMWRACKAILVRGSHVQVWSLFTPGTFALVQREQAHAELYGGDVDPLVQAKPERTQQVLPVDAFLASLRSVRFTYNACTVNTNGKPPSMLDVLLALRHTLHPCVLYDYEPFRRVWGICANDLDITCDIGTTRNAHTVLMTPANVKRLRKNKTYVWWERTTHGSKTQERKHAARHDRLKKIAQ
jgi:hypothetical protein